MKLKNTLAALGMICLAAGAAAQTKITLGYTGVSDFAAAFVAKEEGYFKKYGLDVELQMLTLTSVTPSALQSDSIQIGATVPTVVLQAVDSGMDLVVLANGSVNDKEGRNPGLVVKAGGPIKSAQDLVGKKVGVPGLGGVLHVFVRRWLTEKGVDYKKVIFLETPLPQMNDLLKGGTVDALSAADPFMTRIEQAGTGTVLAHMGRDFPSGFSNALFASSREWAVKNPKAVVAFREALADAVAFVGKEPEKTRAHIGKYVKLPPPVLATLPIPQLMPDISAPRLRFWAESMRQQGMLKNEANLSALIAR